MTAKTHIVEQLGETALVLPNLVAAGLRANDRAKYCMSLLQGFYMAGQWVEPGGGVPVAVMSGRHVVEIMCANLGRAFTNGRSHEHTAGAVPH